MKKESKKPTVKSKAAPKPIKEKEPITIVDNDYIKMQVDEIPKSVTSLFHFNVETVKVISKKLSEDCGKIQKVSRKLELVRVGVKYFAILTLINTLLIILVAIFL